MPDSRERELLQLLDDCNSLTKAEQHFLITIRIRGRVFGIEGNTIYVGRQFFKCMKNLVEAGYVKKRTTLNKTGRSSTYYILSEKGYKFNALLMHHPAYTHMWDKMEKKIAIGARVIG